MSLPNYRQMPTLGDDSKVESQNGQNIQAYVMNFLSDSETDDRESVIKNGQNDPLIGVNEDKTKVVRKQSAKPRPNNRSIGGGETGKRRTRIKYSSEQLVILEENYQRSKFLSTTNRIQLAEQMDLDPIHLKFWWRNRRQIEKKSGGQMKTSEPKKKKKEEEPKKVSRSTSAAPTPSPTPSNFSSSCSMDQWQSSSSSYVPSANQPHQYYHGVPQYQDAYSMPYQLPPIQYITQSHHYPYAESNRFLMTKPKNEQVVPNPYAYGYASAQSNGMEMIYNPISNAMLDNNFTPSHCYYEDKNSVNGHFSHSSGPSTQFTQFGQRMKVEPLDLTRLHQYDDRANVDCIGMDGLMGYWQQMKSEFSDYVPSDQ